MKKIYFIFFLLCSIFLFSCTNDVPASNNDNSNTNNETDSPIQQTETLIGKARIVNGTLNENGGSTWYVAKVSNYTQYFRFRDSNIYYQLTRPDTPVGSSKSGTFTYTDSDKTEFEYRWEGSISGSQVRSKIIILDNDILIVTAGFSCTNSSANTNILYKNVDAYTNVPYMGFGRTSQNGQWYVFTPSGKCYKRYLNLSTNELLILEGTWEKTQNDSYKIFWYKNNKNKYDLLIGTNVYQNAHESEATIPVSLTISDH